MIFDEIGWPWPKHPCSDKSQTPIFDSLLGDEYIEPQPREVGEIREICSLLAEIEDPPPEAFNADHGFVPCSIFRVTKYLPAESRFYLVLRNLVPIGRQEVFVSIAKQKKAFADHMLVHIHEKKISFVDLTSLQPKVLNISEYDSLDSLLVSWKKDCK